MLRVYRGRDDVDLRLSPRRRLSPGLSRTFSGYSVTNRERRVSHMYYGIGGLIVLVIILFFVF